MSLSKIKQLNEVFNKILKECPDVVYIGEEILRKKTTESTLEEGIRIGNKLKSTLEKYRSIAGYGRGLAAPQIGESKSVFVTFVNDQFQIYINPKIIAKSEEFNLYREGCLSCGYLSVDVKRPESIVIKYTDENGEMRKEEADGFLARLLQHEYDHLKGVVNIDIAEPQSIEFMINDPLKEQLRNESEN